MEISTLQWQAHMYILINTDKVLFYFIQNITEFPAL